ncbi:MAG: hypothetical protein ACP5MC_00105 [Candidatus Micrarchaeia archaeon]
MIIVAAIDYDGLLTGIGRAPKVAIAKASNGAITSVEEKEVKWGEAHEKEQEGLHHSNLAKFFISNKATDIVAAGAGPDMQHMIERLGIKLHIASGYYRDVIASIANENK